MDEILRFKGNQNSIYNTDEIVSALKDYLDIALFNKAKIKGDSANSPDKTFNESESFWLESINNNLYAGQIIQLNSFNLLEWIPSSPGLFYTHDAKNKRREALNSYQFREEMERAREREKEFYRVFRPQKRKKIIELKPDEKRGMIQGGYGSLRLAPKYIRDELLYFLCASSSGISHEGITITLRKEHYSKVVEELKKGKIPKVNLTGRLMLLPEELSPIKKSHQYYQKVPKHYIEVLEMDLLEFTKAEDSLVSVAITYSNKEDFMREDSFSYSFCSFSPTKDNRDLREAIYWLQNYAEKYSEEKSPIILGDFDEEFNHFGNVEFPIKDIANGKIPIDKLHFFKELFHYHINEVVMGDKFENISDSTIINRSENISINLGLKKSTNKNESNKNEIKEHLLGLVSDGQLGKALEILLIELKNKGVKDFLNEAIIFNSQLSQLKMQKNLNTITHDNASKESARITMGVIELIQKNFKS